VRPVGAAASGGRTSDREFARSHAPSMTAYLVGDVLAADAAHLVINLVLGLLGGGLGALTTRRLPHPAT